ncbi:spore germination protein [Paenibacillus urinalis]|uniref:Spore germination protein n=1 Tax=Paenibacillus urinalis TaxID=521520 RepID=A0AAX3MXJ9_9BACL|nr:spore germination protein [Paenibacillus urinalis]WDH82360.1 spore germination protein [Paenibacillus urinalis]
MKRHRRSEYLKKLKPKSSSDQPAQDTSEDSVQNTEQNTVQYMNSNNSHDQAPESSDQQQSEQASAGSEYASNGSDQSDKNSDSSNSEASSGSPVSQSSQAPQAKLDELSGNLQQMLDGILIQNGNSSDITIRRLEIGTSPSISIAIVYISSLVKEETINDFIIRSLLNSEFKLDEITDGKDSKNILKEGLTKKVFSLGTVEYCKDWKDLMDKLLLGNTLVLTEDSTDVLHIVTAGGEFRAITESQTESVVRGPKEGFVETLSINVSLLRRRIHSPDLRVTYQTIGYKSNTRVAIVYMDGIADEDVVAEVFRRLDEIQIDGVFDSTNIEELIQDKAITPFPTVYSTERPDTTAVRLLEGRVVLVVDGSPFVLIVPTVFIHFFHSAADYSDRNDIATLLRLLRIISFIILLLGPSLYIAMTTFHYQLIPSSLLYSLISQREAIPFPSFVEAIILETIFELLREAGVRMPRVVGQAANIVGGLVLGQAAVEAGIVSPLLTIVIAMTGIASFAIPTYTMAIAGRIFRFGFIVLAATFGLYGIMLGLIALLAHMNSLRSFGVPYMTPFSPFVLKQQKDAVLRLPVSLMKQRPGSRSGEYNVVTEDGPVTADKTDDKNESARKNKQKGS